MTKPAGYRALIERDWEIPQGSDTTNPLIFKTRETPEDEWEYPDLTAGWTARAQIRKKVGSTEWVTFLSSSLSGPRISLETEGRVYIILPAATTEDESWDAYGKGVYDCELISPTDYVWRLAEGKVEVFHDVTRTA